MRGDKMYKRNALMMFIGILILALIITLFFMFKSRIFDKTKQIKYNINVQDERIGEKGVQSKIPEYSQEEIEEMEKRYEEEAAPNIVD